MSASALASRRGLVALIARGVALVWLAAPTALLAQAFEIGSYTIDSGGGYSTGGAYAVHGTIGQPDAGRHSGGSYVLQGGFWSGASHLATGPIFRDGFESIGKNALQQALRVARSATTDEIPDFFQGSASANALANRARIAIGISRMRPSDVSLVEVDRARRSAVEYEIRIANEGEVDVADLQVSVPPPIAMREMLWTCETHGVGCAPHYGGDSIDARVDLRGGGMVRFVLSALLDETRDFVVISATATGPVANPARASAVLVEPISESALRRDGFEPSGADVPNQE